MVNMDARFLAFMHHTARAALIAMVFCVSLSLASDLSDSSDPAYSFDDRSNVLTILADVPDYGEGALRPWDGFKNRVHSVEVSEGVESIGDRAFKGMPSLQAVSFPESLARIGSESFAGCVELSEAELGPGLKHIGDRAFSGCPRLAMLAVGCDLDHCGADVFDGSGAAEGVDGIEVVVTASSIPEGMFRSSSEGGLKLFSLVLDGVRSIGDSAFRDADLDSIELPPSVSSIGAYAFAGSSISATSFEGIPSIGGYAFSGCHGLAHVDLSHFSSIPEGAFKDSSVEEAVFSIRLKTIGPSAFEGTRLREAVLPGSLDSVGSRAFADCICLEHAAFTHDLVRLSDHAFSGCVSLKTVEVQNTSYCGSGVFDGCDSLEKAFFAQGLFDVPPACRKHTGLSDGSDVLIEYDLGRAGGSCILFSDTLLKPSMIRGVDPDDFMGWFDGSGKRIESISDITSSASVRAEWVQEERDSASPAEFAVCGLSVLCAVAASVCFFRRD